MPKVSRPEEDLLAPHTNLDFSKGIRGKHYASMQSRSHVVLLAPDLVESFPNSDAVNEALRGLKKIADRASAKPTRRKQTVAS